MQQDREDFARLTDPYRRELLAHCYRMLGSVHDAEDLVQETYLRAWRSFDGFEGRSSLRTWMYRIATSACLTALESRGRRPLPTGLGGPHGEPEGPLHPDEEISWLQPLPDVLYATEPEDPAAVAVSRDSVRLALVAALQHLPARQRAVLILRDVLAWRAAEVADLLDTSTAAVNSALQRARAQLEEISPAEESVGDLDDPARQEFLERYLKAFESFDMTALTEVLHEDVVWEMPPFPEWFVGRENVVRLTLAHCPGAPGRMRAVRASANGQPAVALYIRREGRTAFEPHSVQVLTVGKELVEKVVAFFDLSLFPLFGLPESLPA
ncbi:sigma-70 family RNA polymerase sigma factor [Flindersiella endophytica]